MAKVSFDVALFPTEPAEQTVRLAKLAEDLGYDGVWVGDSHIIWREMYVLLGAIAAQTKRVKLGSGVTHPLVRHLSLTASSFLTLAELAGERMRIGIGIGASGPINIGVKRASRKALTEAVSRLRALLKGEAVSLDGKEMRLMFADHPAIPIFVAASTAGTQELAANIADGVIHGGRQDLLKEWVSGLRQAITAAGRDPRSVPVVSWVPCCVAHDSKAAKEAVKPHVARSGWTLLPQDGRGRKGGSGRRPARGGEAQPGVRLLASHESSSTAIWFRTVGWIFFPRLGIPPKSKRESTKSSRPESTS